jgi:hypothetical protein
MERTGSLHDWLGGDTSRLSNGRYFPRSDYLTFHQPDFSLHVRIGNETGQTLHLPSDGTPMAIPRPLASNLPKHTRKSQ